MVLVKKTESHSCLMTGQEERDEKWNTNLISTLKPTFYFAGDKALAQFVWAGCGFSVLGVTQNQTGHGPEQPAPVTLLWALCTESSPEVSSNLSWSGTLWNSESCLFFYLNPCKGVTSSVMVLPAVTTTGSLQQLL